MTGSAKMLLLSILFASILIPARAAMLKDPRLGLRKALINMALFNVFYVIALRFIYPRLL
jgi:hypothetical protein